MYEQRLCFSYLFYHSTNNMLHSDSNMIKVMILSNSHKFYSTVRQFSSVPSAIKRIMRKAYAKHGRWNPTEMWVQLDNGKWTKQTIEAFTK